MVIIRTIRQYRVILPTAQLKSDQAVVARRRYLSRKAEDEDGVEACVRDSAESDCRPLLWR